jgi:hypothetical protein
LPILAAQLTTFKAKQNKTIQAKVNAQTTIKHNTIKKKKKKKQSPQKMVKGCRPCW